MHVAEQAGGALAVPAIRRVHSYSGTSSGASTENGNESPVGRGGEANVVARRTLSALEPTFNFASSAVGQRSASMHAISGVANAATSSTTFEASLVGPSIPLALRRASSDYLHTPGERDAGTSGIQEKGGFRMGVDSPSAFTTGWPASSSLRMTTGKTPTTPPKATFNPGSPQSSAGLGMMTTPVRTSVGARARANSGTRVRGPGGTFGTPSGVPVADTRKRSGSGSGNGALAGPWHARTNVCAVSKSRGCADRHRRRASHGSCRFRHRFAPLWQRTRTCPVRKFAQKPCSSVSSFPIRSPCQ